MKFAFNPESDIEIELVDRCIHGEYVVTVTLTDNVTRLDPVRICRRGDGLMTITVVELRLDDGVYVDDIETPGTVHTLDAGAIDLIYIH